MTIFLVNGSGGTILVVLVRRQDCDGGDWGSFGGWVGRKCGVMGWSMFVKVVIG